MIRALPLLLLAVLAAWAMPARAVTTCTIANPTLAFGTVSNGQVDTQTTLTVTCTSSALLALTEVKLSICVGLGAGPGGSLTGWRRMVNTPGDGLDYQIHSNSGRTTVFGTSSTSSPAWSQAALTYPSILLAGSGSVNFVLYGRYPASQVLSFGSYTSTLPVSLQFAYSEPLLLGLGPTPTSCTQTGTNIQNSGLITTATVNITANVAASCGAYTRTDMDFGTNTGRVTANIDRTSTIGLTCINRTPWQIGLNNGSNADASGNRRMIRTIGTTNYYIPYELYQDSARTTRWGNTINSGAVVAGSGSGTAQTLTVHGRVLPTTATGTPPGTYSDIVTVTITY